MARRNLRPLVGLGMVIAIVAVVALAVVLFRGGYRDTAGVTVISDRAGLVMNPQAKVKMRGVQVGTVESVSYRPDGTADLKLAIDNSALHLIPSNVGVDIASSTVFGAKSVELVAPPKPSDVPLRPARPCRASTSWWRPIPFSSSWSRC